MGVGLLVDRRGPAPVVGLGALAIGGGLIGLGFVREPWHMFVVYALLGVGYPAVAAASISATLAPWFERGFGAALGVALTGASVGGALVPLAIVYFSAELGFEVVMPVLGAGLMGILLCASAALRIVGRHRPTLAAASDTPAPESLEVLRRPLFWRLSIAAALALGAQVGFLAHQVPILAARADPVDASDRDHCRSLFRPGPLGDRPGQPPPWQPPVMWGRRQVSQCWPWPTRF